MTEIEARALALVRAADAADQLRTLPQYVDKAVLCEALCRAIEREEATEARHAEELRELRERFSEAVKAMFDGFNDAYCPETFMRILLGPSSSPHPTRWLRRPKKRSARCYEPIHQTV